MKPKITFLIATRNRAKLIKETLQSIINQSIDCWEALVIDDRGTDDTKEVIKKFNDNRIRYYKLDSLSVFGHGQNCARNFGIIAAESDIIAIIDSDDICYPNRAEITLKAFNRDPKLDVFYGDIVLWDDKTNETRERKTTMSPFDINRLKDHNFIPHPASAFRRKVLVDNPYNTFFKIAEDYELFTRLAVKGYKFSYTKEKLVKYRVSGQHISFSHGKNEKDTSNQTHDFGKFVKVIRGWCKYDKNLFDNILNYTNMDNKK